MPENQSASQSFQTETKKIDYFKLVQIGLSRWYWIIASLLICLFIAYFYLRYTPKIFETSATIRMESKKSPLSGLITGTVSDEQENSIQAESYVIKSKALLTRALEKLNYTTAFYKKGNFLITETYPFQPFQVKIESIDTLNGNYPNFSIYAISSTQYHLTYNIGQRTVENNYVFGKDVIQINDLRFRVINSAVGLNNIYTFRFNSINSLLGRASGVQIAETGKGTNIVQLSLTDSNPYFASDFLNVLIQEYQVFDRDQRALSDTHTIDFINEQLSELAQKVEHSQNAIAAYKQGKGILDVPTASSKALGQLTTYETQRSALKIQEIALTQLEKQVNDHKGQITYNFNVDDASNSLLGSLVTKYNAIFSEQIEKSNYYQPQSQIMTDLNRDMQETQKSIINNIHSNIESIHTTIAYLDKIIGGYNNDVSTLPTIEKDIFGLERNFNINEKVFTYLMEKKLETQVSRASILPGSSIVETAHPNLIPISPVNKSIYIYAIFIGLVIPILVIIVLRALSPTINSVEEIEHLSRTPVLGVIRSYPSKMDTYNKLIISTPMSKTIFSESVRAVRTSLSFIASDRVSKVISVTSEVSGEGKSFVSLNLANALSLIDKKVIIISTDLRKRRLHQTFGVSENLGLSTYLAGQNELNEVLFNSSNANMDFIPSGPLAPNPSELLHSKRMRDLLTYLKTIYEYILLDNAPIGLVADAMPVLKQSDINLFVIRSQVSKKSSATLADALHGELNIDNFYIVMNGFHENKLYESFYSTSGRGRTGYSGYYGKYSYYHSGYYEEASPSGKKWKFWNK